MPQPEPVTALTDYVLALQCALFGFLLLRAARRPPQRARRLWGFSFLATALAAAGGGSYHLLTTSRASAAGQALWIATILAIGLGAALLLCGSIVAAAPPRWRTALLGAVGLKYALYAVWIVADPEYRFVILDYAIAMIAVLALQPLAPSAASAWIGSGILLSFAAGAVQVSGFSLHRHFNNNDLYHVMQMAAMVLLFIAGRRLEDRRPPESRAAPAAPSA
ncbi:MAG TPA: hypothetical protein VGB99_16935 [Acidobacteriota bacterium]